MSQAFQSSWFSFPISFYSYGLALSLEPYNTWEEQKFLYQKYFQLLLNVFDQQTLKGFGPRPWQKSWYCSNVVAVLFFALWTLQIQFCFIRRWKELVLFFAQWSKKVYFEKSVCNGKTKETLAKTFFLHTRTIPKKMCFLAYLAVVILEILCTPKSTLTVFLQQRGLLTNVYVILAKWKNHCKHPRWEKSAYLASNFFPFQNVAY